MDFDLDQRLDVMPVHADLADIHRKQPAGRIVYSGCFFIPVISFCRKDYQGSEKNDGKGIDTVELQIHHRAMNRVQTCQHRQ